MKALKVLFTLALIAGLLYGGYYAYARFIPRKKEVVSIPTTKVQQGDFVIKVTEIGKVKARKSVQISAPFGGKIIKLCKEGSIVKPGDFLAQMDTTELTRKQRDETLSYEQALADVQKAEEELRIAKISAQLDIKDKLSQLDYDRSELEDAKNKLKRQQRLFAESIVIKADVENEEVKVRSKELAVKKGLIAVEIARKKSLSDESKKRAEINILGLKGKKNRLDAEAATEDLSQATVKANARGIVVFQDVWRSGQMGKLSEGDDVHRRENIMEIPDLASLLVIVPVRETEIHRVKVGAKCTISLEADPSSLFHGKVEKIDRIAKEPHPWENPTAPGQKTFEVTIGLKETDASKIRPGMTANTDIIEKKLEKVLNLPIECVFYHEGKKFVYIKEGENYVKKEVDVGERNENFVVITKGLKGGEDVALRDPTKSIEESEATSKKENGSSPVDLVPKNGKKGKGK
ncbi:MAG: efflux RND transporter periplasmic adaptor subunit [Candidatus Eremiobacteraeota bacterium]|nr:efflux RND transporter periplasmic adaptor subunit [Candidatus Eremiobacteraeota bacterium]